jgi:hypothetical protein
MSDLEDKIRRYFGKHLRRFFKLSPIRTAVFEERRNGHTFSCYICKGESTLKKDFQVEHIDPVVPPSAQYVTSFDYFVRMFGYSEGSISLDNMDLVCIPCHEKKTAEEDVVRKAHGTGRFSQAARIKAAETRAKRRLSRGRKAKKTRTKRRKSR